MKVIIAPISDCVIREFVLSVEIGRKLFAGDWAVIAQHFLLACLVVCFFCRKETARSLQVAAC